MRVYEIDIFGAWDNSPTILGAKFRVLVEGKEEAEIEAARIIEALGLPPDTLYERKYVSG